MSKGKIAFIGSGMIGTGLAVNFLLHGYEAVLQTRPQDVPLTENRLQQMFQTLVNNGVVSREQVKEIMGRCRITVSVPDAAQGAVFVQEAVPENLEQKLAILSEVESCVDPSVPIASSTSSFLPSQLQEGALHPERIMVGHPYHPAYLIPLVELSGSPQTSLQAVQRAKHFYTDAGKIAIVALKEKSGGIVNRLSWAANAEAKRTVAEGICSVEDMDKAIMFGPGMRMAVLGQITTIGIGMGPNGYYDYSLKYGAPMTEEQELIAKGYQDALAARDPATGNDYESISVWRDNMLIGLLRLHGLL